MGISSSKDLRDAVEVIEEESKKMPITPSYKVIRCDDPRSPSAGLDRTPIEFFDKNYSPVSLSDGEWGSNEDITPLRRQRYPTTLIDDPRSPTLGISRTPIQVSSSLQTDSNTQLSFVENDVDKILHQPESSILDDSALQVSTDDGDKSSNSTYSTSSDPSLNAWLDSSHDPISSAPYSFLFKTLSKVNESPGSYVYEDKPDSAEEALKSKKETKSSDCNRSSEKENDVFKRKLSFTPETKIGFKVRTPLGSRCNFQDSPSQVLKMKQVQKVDQEMENDGENKFANSFGSNERSLKQKKQQHIEWDNKDSTLIM